MDESVINTIDEREEWEVEAEWPTYFLIDALRAEYVLWSDEDCEWWATRPPSEEDDEAAFGKGVSRPLRDLPLPLHIYTPPRSDRVLSEWLTPEPGGSDRAA